MAMENDVYLKTKIRYLSSVIISCLLLIVILFSGCEQIKHYPEIQRGESSNFKLINQDKDYPRYSFEIPSVFEVKSYQAVNYPSMILVTGTDINSNDPDVMVINIDISNLSKPAEDRYKTTQEWIQSSLKSRTIKNVKFMYRGKVEFNHVTGWESIVNYTSFIYYPYPPPGGTKIGVIDLYFTLEKHIWHIHFLCGQNRFQEAVKAYEHMLGTFQFLDR
jgi:hypothetical protein